MYEMYLLDLHTHISNNTSGYCYSLGILLQSLACRSKAHKTVVAYKNYPEMCSASHVTYAEAYSGKTTAELL